MPNAVQEFLEHAAYERVDIANRMINTTKEELCQAILQHQDCILYGPPGTSKTYLIDQLPTLLGDKLGLFKAIQFHSNYSYEEFIEGVVPDPETKGFRYESGVFLQFCQEAQSVPADKLCLFVIDEINRANVTAVFGEVLNLMENKGTRKLSTAKRHIEFSIPANVVIIGTMNTADKTLAKLDFAFRRRFRFLAVFPSREVLHQMVSSVGISEDVGVSVDEYVTCFEVLNTKIVKHPLLGKNLTLGHVLWTRKGVTGDPYSKEEIGRIFKETIFPQIENYCGSNKDVLGSLLGTDLRDKVIYGFEISDDEIISYLSSLKNSRVVTA